MEITKQQIEKMATEYAKQFDYAEDSSPFLDYIAGFEKALSLFAVSGQSEQLNALDYLTEKGITGQQAKTIAEWMEEFKSL